MGRPTPPLTAWPEGINMAVMEITACQHVLAVDGSLWRAYAFHPRDSRFGSEPSAWAARVNGGPEVWVDLSYEPAEGGNELLTNQDRRAFVDVLNLILVDIGEQRSEVPYPSPRYYFVV